MARRVQASLAGSIAEWVTRDELKLIADTFAGMETIGDLADWFTSPDSAALWPYVGMMGYRARLGVRDDSIDGAAVARQVLRQVAERRRDRAIDKGASGTWDAGCASCGRPVDDGFYCVEHQADAEAELERLVRP